MGREDFNEEMHVGGLGDSVRAHSDVHVGATSNAMSITGGDTEDCPPGSPNGRPVSFGVRITGIAAGATAVITFTVSRRVKIKCMSVPPAQAVNFTVTSMKVGDIENIINGGASVTGGTLGPIGVSGTEFLPYATCANMLSGQCVSTGEPLAISALNNSGVAASFEISVHGTTAKPLA